MSHDVREVRVDIRHHTLATAAPLDESADGEVFVALDDPPPVRTLLAIHDGKEGPHALEVTRVVETDTDASRRGVFGRFRDPDVLRGLESVGTEHLASGEQVSAAGSDDSDHAGFLAMPAPVVDPDPSDRIDVSELRQLEEGGSDDDSDDDDLPRGDNGSPPSEDGDDSPRRGKRRRGRKRRGPAN
jgi:hypothetical protein